MNSIIIHNRQENAKQTEKILALTGFTSEELFWLKHDTGMNFLKLMCRNDQWGMQFMSSQTFFWSWWINLWNNRDSEWLINNKHHLKGTSKSVRERYLLANNLDLLYKDCNRKRLEEGYTLVVSHTNKIRQRNNLSYVS